MQRTEAAWRQRQRGTSTDVVRPSRTPPFHPPKRAPGCLEPQCALCQHSTDRRCTFNFDRKYVGMRSAAPCGLGRKPAGRLPLAPSDHASTLYPLPVARYLVNDRMLARCGAVIRIEAVDCATGSLHEGELPDVFLEMMVLDGNMYDTKYLGEADRWGGWGGG
jgi:hypothetical protein